jgi:hypothetical protein
MHQQTQAEQHFASHSATRTKKLCSLASRTHAQIASSACTRVYNFLPNEKIYEDASSGASDISASTGYHGSHIITYSKIVYHLLPTPRQLNAYSENCILASITRSRSVALPATRPLTTIFVRTNFILANQSRTSTNCCPKHGRRFRAYAHTLACVSCASRCAQAHTGTHGRTLAHGSSCPFMLPRCRQWLQLHMLQSQVRSQLQSLRHAKLNDQPYETCGSWHTTRTHIHTGSRTYSHAMNGTTPIARHLSSLYKAKRIWCIFTALATPATASAASLWGQRAPSASLQFAEAVYLQASLVAQCFAYYLRLHSSCHLLPALRRDAAVWWQHTALLPLTTYAFPRQAL